MNEFTEISRARPGLSGGAHRITSQTEGCVIDIHGLQWLLHARCRSQRVPRPCPQRELVRPARLPALFVPHFVPCLPCRARPFPAPSRCPACRGRPVPARPQQRRVEAGRTRLLASLRWVGGWGEKERWGWVGVWLVGQDGRVADKERPCPLWTQILNKFSLEMEQNGHDPDKK